MRSPTVLMWLVLSCLVPVVAVHPKPLTQTVTLNPGWNAVFLEVNPVSSAPAAAFSGIPGLASVWLWNPRTSTVDFVQDPETLVPTQSEWLAYLPGNPIVTTLHAVHGERSYLIELDGEESVEWTVTGEPALPRIRWTPESFNLVGFHLEPGEEPFFEDFFSSSPAHAGQEIYYLNEEGRWELVTSPATTRMKAGEAFWVYCGGHSGFGGALVVEPGLDAGLHYGAMLSEQTLRLKNLAAADAVVSMALTGDAPLSHWRFEPDASDVGWKSFPLDVGVPAGQEAVIRVGARRSGLVSGHRVDGNLVVTDGAGMRIVVAASVEGVSRAGLWVGEVRVDKVSEPRVAPEQDFPLGSGGRRYDTASEFSFRIILHVDTAGSVRLLKQVMQMWDETQQRNVLFSDQSKIVQYTATERSRRISSAAFGALSATEPRFETLMTGQFGGDGGRLASTIVVARDDPTNPFHHRYHPDHKDPSRAYEVTREIELIFSATDGDGHPIGAAEGLEWGSTALGGVYRETLTGLHRTPIRVEGSFLLRKTSDIGVLE